MKKETMQKLMALPKTSQDKVWKLAMDRLKAEKTQKDEVTPVQGKLPKK